MKRLIGPLLLLLAAQTFAQQQINPATQIKWPAITGAGLPTSIPVACTTANYGQPYLNTASTPNTSYVCSVSGWILGVPTDLVKTDPMATQTITQPVNTSLNVITSGTGSLKSNGSPVLTTVNGSINLCLFSG
jgi:hypothetical protein